MTTLQTTALTRACSATTVPYGETVTLDAGGEVQVVQQLGGSITVRTELGLLLRIDGADADALGLEPPSVPDPVVEGSFDIAKVMAVLDTIYDPEIPISIVELGLVYRCESIDQPDGTRRVEIDMTMTAPGCGMGDVLSADATRAVAAIPGVDDVEVTLVWDPPWSMHLISEGARLQLGLL
ncbi:MAG: putative Fe-S cluster assembly protein SufT [Acidimicrobiales bacterium]